MVFDIEINNQEMRFLHYYSFPIYPQEEIYLSFYSKDWSKNTVLKLYDNKVRETIIPFTSIVLIPKEYYKSQGFSFCLEFTDEQQTITTNFLNIPIKEVFKCM